MLSSVIEEVAPPGGPANGVKTVPLPGEGRRRARSGWWVFGALWLLAMGYVALTGTNYQRIAAAGEAWEAAQRQAPENVVGRGACAAFAVGQPPIQYDSDSLCWINLAQRQWAQGTVRPHDFPFDNTPYGRERHWSSSFSWWLLGLGGITHALTGTPMEMAIAASAAWANPALFVLFLTLTGLILRRRLDAWPTGVFLVTLAACWQVQWDFSYGRPDHHGLHLMAYLGLMLAAALGGFGFVRNGASEAEDAGEDGRWLVRPQTRRQARHWLTVSGVCGGTGLWIGSTQQIFGIAALGAGAVLGCWLFARADGDARIAPDLWRRWARVGAATSLVFYLIEYFPAHLGMRLEVNHPLIALGWLGAGELMWTLMTARLDRAGTLARAGYFATRGALGLAAMSAPVLALRFGPASWCVLGDPIIKHSFVAISEGQPWLDFRHPQTVPHGVWEYTGVLLLVVPLAAGLLVVHRRRSSGAQLTAVVTGLAASAVFLGWSLLQHRWLGFLEGSLATLALVAAPWLGQMRGVCGCRVPLGLLALTVPGWLGFARLQTDAYADDPARHAQTMLAGMLTDKEVAWNLRLDAPGRPVVRVMAPLTDGPALHYYDPSVQTVASQYWENVAGCRAAIEFFNDPGDTAARRIARERELDFVVVIAEPYFVLQTQLYGGGKVDPRTAVKTLAYRLANPVHPQPPEWLEPVALADAPVARKAGYRIYRVRREKL